MYGVNILLNDKITNDLLDMKVRRQLPVDQVQVAPLVLEIPSPDRIPR